MNELVFNHSADNETMKNTASIQKLFQQTLPDDSFISHKEEFSSDFGNVFSLPPPLVIATRSEQELQATLQIARDNKLPITIRGAGHSLFGQTLTETGVLVVNHAKGHLDFEWVDELYINVSGRSSWSDLTKALKVQNAAPCVLTDYLDLTVGGTLSVGGYGLRSITNGAQIDNVKALRVIKPDGEAIWCDENENSSLFQFALAGLGQIGVIERVVLRTVKNSRRVYTVNLPFSDGLSMAQSLANHRSGSGSLPNFLSGYNLGDGFFLEYGFEAETENEARMMAAATIENINLNGVAFYLSEDYEQQIHTKRQGWLNEFAHHHRLWCDYFFQYDQYLEFIKFINLPKVKPMVESFLGASYTLLTKRRQHQCRIPFASHNIAGDEKMIYGVGLYHMVPPNRPNGIQRTALVHQLCLEKCLELGGRPYRYGWCDLAPEKMHQIYGNDLDRLLELKRDLDPDNLFNSHRTRGKISEKH